MKPAPAPAVGDTGATAARAGKTASQDAERSSRPQLCLTLCWCLSLPQRLSLSFLKL